MLEFNQVSEAVISVVSEWCDQKSVPPRAINHGECDAFANEVCHRYSGDLEIKTTDDEGVLGPPENPQYHVEPYHVWVYDGSQHYDSETPEGVSSWRDLPFFQRAGYGDKGTY